MTAVAERFGDLRPRDREIVTLSAFSGKKQQAIAAHMGVAIGTVTSGLSRARKALEG